MSRATRRVIPRHRKSAPDATCLSGFGPKSTEALAQIDIFSLEQLKAMDPYEIYVRLKKSVPGVSLNFLYAIIAAQEGGGWRDVQRTRRTAILLRLEELGLAPG